METTAALEGLACTECDAHHDPAAVPGRCPDCGGPLVATYDVDAQAGETDRESLADSRFDGVARYGDLLPFELDAATSMNEGTTPLVACPGLADELGVAEVYVKDEGANPTGTTVDRQAAVAVAAAREQGAETVAHPTTGDSGQSVAAYAARADMDAHVWLAERAGYTQKAMVEIHGGELHVVEGEITDAGAGYAERMEQEDWYSTKTFVTPYRHETKKTMLYETVEQLDWEVPDHVVYPTGGGVGLVGMHKAATELRDLGLTDDLPAMYAAQSEGCAPVVRAFEEGRDVHEPWDTPDTICGGIEIPDPGASPLILDALRESDGGAVATSDDDILDAGTLVAKHEGVEMGATCAAAASGAWQLAEDGEFGADDTVVLLNTGTANKDADVLRSHLMSKGI